jgi:DNA-directed RNA polymerase specialized sigma24 family protein
VVDQIIEHYKANIEALSKKAGRILKDHAYGEDVAQETYECAFRYYKSFNAERGDFDKWMNKIFWRTLSKYQGFVKGTGFIEPIDEFEVSTEAAKVLLEESSLPDHYKHILHLLYVMGYSTKEITKDGSVSSAVCYKAVRLFKKEAKIKYALVCI